MNRQRASLTFIASAYEALRIGDEDAFKAYMMGVALVNDRAYMPTRDEFLTVCRQYAREIAYAVADGFISASLLNALVEAYRDEVVFVLLPERPEEGAEYSDHSAENE